MRITSRTPGPDDVGSVEATVDGHGWVEGLGAPCPGQRQDAPQLAPTASLSVVMAYLSSLATAAADRPQAMDGRTGPERPVQWPRLNALSLVPLGARRPRPARVWTRGPAPGPPPVPPRRALSSSVGRISSRALAPAARALDWSGRYGPGRTRSR